MLRWGSETEALEVEGLGPIDLNYPTVASDGGDKCERDVAAYYSGRFEQMRLRERARVAGLLSLPPAAALARLGGGA